MLDELDLSWNRFTGKALPELLTAVCTAPVTSLHLKGARLGRAAALLMLRRMLPHERLTTLSFNQVRPRFRRSGGRNT